MDTFYAARSYSLISTMACLWQLESMKKLFFLALFLPSLASALPSGLCLLKSKAGGFGHGYVVDNFIITAAHVLNAADGEWWCIQNNQLVRVDHLKTGIVSKHPKYKDEAVSFYDIGMQQLSVPFLSDFIMPEATSFEELVIATQKEGVETDFDIFLMDKKVKHHVEEEKVIGLNMEDDEVQTEQSHLIFRFVTVDISSGHSGVPILNYDASLNKYLVIGMIYGGSSNTNESILAGSIQEYQNLDLETRRYADALPSFLIRQFMNTVLAKSVIETNSELSCESFLNSKAE